jgi:hypothetical protein
MLQQGRHLVKNSSLHSHIIWAMYILGLSSSWGTSRICPAWSPSEHQLAPALSPIWGIRSHAVRRRLFIVLMTAAHISPNVFPSETSSATYMYCFLRYIQNHSYLLYITSTWTIKPFIYMTYSQFHFFRSSWQAGCPRSFVSDTRNKITHVLIQANSFLSYSYESLQQKFVWESSTNLVFNKCLLIPPTEFLDTGPIRENICLSW